MTLSVILNIIMIAIGVIIHMIGFGYLFFNRSIHISSRGRVSGFKILASIVNASDSFSSRLFFFVLMLTRQSGKNQTNNKANVKIP